VILLTRLNGQRFALNPDLLERAEATPDTVLTLVDGSKFVVSDSLEALVAAVEDFRAGVIARAQQLVGQQAGDHLLDRPGPHPVPGRSAAAETRLAEPRAAQAAVAEPVPLHTRRRP